MMPKAQTRVSLYLYFAIAVLAWCTIGPANAALVEIMDEESAAWRATHIVIVDSAGAVEECWKGDAAHGEIIGLSALGVERNVPLSDDVFAPGSARPGGRRTRGGRFLLFLTATDPGPPRRWNSADGRAGSPIGLSMAWLEQDGVYGWKTGWVGPGALAVTRFATLASLSRMVRHTLDLQRDYAAALAEPDLARRAWRIAPFLSSHTPCVQATSLTALTKLHGKALPVFRQLIFNQQFNNRTTAMVRAMAFAGGRRAVPSLIELANREVRYWRSHTMRFKNHRVPDDIAYQHRKWLLCETMKSLAALPDVRAKSVARAVLAFTRATPNLDVPDDASSIEKNCRKIMMY